MTKVHTLSLAIVVCVSFSPASYASDLQTIMGRAKPIAQSVVKEADRPGHTLSSVAKRAGLLCNALTPLLTIEQKTYQLATILLHTSQVCSVASTAMLAPIEDDTAKIMVQQMRDSAEDIAKVVLN